MAKQLSLDSPISRAQIGECKKTSVSRMPILASAVSIFRRARLLVKLTSTKPEHARVHRATKVPDILYAGTARRTSKLSNGGKSPKHM